MAQKYLLDTNAYFNFLRSVKAEKGEQAQNPELIKKIREGNPCVSVITKVEIISVLGKYARGKNGGKQRCDCIISDDGTRCTNFKYVEARKRWKPRQVRDWKKLIEETMEGKSNLISLELLPFDLDTINAAQHIVEHALVHSFASMDAMIAATAKQEIANGHDITVVTSDKGLKACLDKCSIPYWDAFAS